MHRLPLYQARTWTWNNVCHFCLFCSYISKNIHNRYVIFHVLQTQSQEVVCNFVAKTLNQKQAKAGVKGHKTEKSRVRTRLEVRKLGRRSSPYGPRMLAGCDIKCCCREIEGSKITISNSWNKDRKNFSS